MTAETKICIECTEPKHNDDFYLVHVKYRRNECKLCHNKKSKIRSARYYKNKPKQYIVNATKYKLKIKEYVRNYKHNKQCVDCKLPHPYWRMDFDHLDNKIIDISLAVKRGWSINKVQKEIAKCELVCANCHRDRTRVRLDKKIRDRSSTTERSE